MTVVTRMVAAVCGPVGGTALLVAAAALATSGHGKYVGTTSERGAVTFTVPAGNASVMSFSATDGYNGKCEFHGGVGGIPNFTVSIPGMKIGPASEFTATTKAKLGPFSGTITVKGKLTGSRVSGTLDQVGATCGKGAGNPSAHDYLETFSAGRVGG
jgi:hypothetical protein